MLSTPTSPHKDVAPRGVVPAEAAAEDGPQHSFFDPAPPPRRTIFRPRSAANAPVADHATFPAPSEERIRPTGTPTTADESGSPASAPTLSAPSPAWQPPLGSQPLSQPGSTPRGSFFNPGTPPRMTRFVPRAGTAASGTSNSATSGVAPAAAVVEEQRKGDVTAEMPAPAAADAAQLSQPGSKPRGGSFFDPATPPRRTIFAPRSSSVTAAAGGAAPQPVVSAAEAPARDGDADRPRTTLFIPGQKPQSDAPGAGVTAAAEAPANAVVAVSQVPQAAPAAATNADAAELNEGQQKVLRAALAGESVFITGGAGTGKSVVLRRIVRLLPGDATAVTATTGLAALNIHGCTIHSWSGLGKFNDAQPLWVSAMRALQRRDREGKLYVVRNWRSVKTLVIDEVSMLSRSLFEVLDEIGRRARRDPRPFGGVQLILTGDFLQLPPVVRERPTAAGGTARPRWPRTPEERLAAQEATAATFCYSSPVWTHAKIRTYTLRQIMRQASADPLPAMLTRLRVGNFVAEDCMRIIEQRKHHWPPGTVPVRLVPTNREAAVINVTEYERLQSEQMRVRARDFVKEEISAAEARKIRESGDNSIKTFRDERERKWYALTAYLGKPKRFERAFPGIETRLPLKVGTRVMLRVNLDKAYVNGCCGTVTELIDPRNLKQRLFDDQARIVRWLGLRSIPIVKFDHAELKPRHILPVELEDRATPCDVASRFQLPLSHAWAMTIHKAQGMSIDYVDTDLGRCFADGQAYVALSRARSLAGLEAARYSRGVLKANAPAVQRHREFAEEERAREGPAARAALAQEALEAERVVARELEGRTKRWRARLPSDTATFRSEEARQRRVGYAMELAHLRDAEAKARSDMRTMERHGRRDIEHQLAVEQWKERWRRRDAEKGNANAAAAAECGGGGERRRRSRCRPAGIGYDNDEFDERAWLSDDDNDRCDTVDGAGGACCQAGDEPNDTASCRRPPQPRPWG